MNKPLIVNKQRTINATLKETWEVITTPQYFNEWMFVPGQVTDEKPFGLGSKIEWINDNNLVYLTGEVIAFVPTSKIVISLQDVSWNKIVPKGSVTYEYHLAETENGTQITFCLGNLSIDPDGTSWYRSYKASDEIASIEKVIKEIRKNKID